MASLSGGLTLVTLLALLAELLALLTLLALSTLLTLGVAPLRVALALALGATLGLSLWLVVLLVPLLSVSHLLAPLSTLLGLLSTLLGLLSTLLGLATVVLWAMLALSGLLWGCLWSLSPTDLLSARLRLLCDVTLWRVLARSLAGRLLPPLLLSLPGLLPALAPLKTVLGLALVAPALLSLLGLALALWGLALWRLRGLSPLLLTALALALWLSVATPTALALVSIRLVRTL